MSKKSNRRMQGRQARLTLSNGRPSLEISFTAGALTAYGGVPLAEKVSRLTGWIEGAASRLKENTTGALITHNKLKKLKQCVLLTLTGNQDTNDADRLRFDPAFLEALGLDDEEGLASQPTISRFLADVTQPELDGLSEWFREFYLLQHPVKPRRIVLFVDGTAVQTYGKQEGTGYRGGKYKKEMYFPLTVFDQSGCLLGVKLRQGYQSESKTVLAMLEPIVKTLRERWKHVEIVLIVDGAFKSSELLNWCEKNSVFYLAGYANTHAVKEKLKGERRGAMLLFRRTYGKERFTGEKGDEKAQEEHKRIRDIEDSKKRMEEERALAARRARVLGETTHKATTWPKEDPYRRMIFRVDHTDKGSETRCLLTNFEEYMPEQLYEMYCRRGTSEQWIGELKYCLKFNSQTFRANHFRLYIHGMAYMILWLLRRSCSFAFRSFSLQSIRKILIEIPASITYRSSRTTLWELTDRYPYQTEFLRVARKLERAS